MDALAKAVLNCTICNQRFKEPKTLPCKHVFCKVCLQSHCLESATKDAFRCPICDTVVKVSDPNTPLLEWADSLPTSQQFDKSGANELSENVEQKKCMLCLQKWKAVAAVKYCKSCQEYFCDECGNQHWLLRSSKEHRVWLITDLAKLKKDPLVRAKLELVFSAKHRARTKRRLSGQHSTEANTSEKKDCFITGACFIDGNIVLADKGNMRVSLFDENYVTQSVYKTSCYDVIEMNDYFLAVSCPEEHCLKIFSVYNHVIEEDRNISLGAECYGLCRVRENIAVALASKPTCINIYSGSVLKEEIKLENGKLPLRNPGYITFHEKTERFYISDNMASCLKSADRIGRIVWEKKIEMCNGLAVFGAYVLIARSDINTVDLLNPDGQILKSIITPEDGLSNIRVLSIDDRSEEDAKKMIVVDCAELAHMFVLSDPMLDDDLKTFVRNDRSRRTSRAESHYDAKKKDRSKLCNIL